MGPVLFSDVQKTHLTLSWKPSEEDGGSPILAYTIDKRESWKSSWTTVSKVPADTTSYCAKTLKENQEYFFRIIAINSVGKSDALLSESIMPKSPFSKFLLDLNVLITILAESFIYAKIGL